MATALVLGGSGQIGRGCVPALLRDGWDVRVNAGDPDVPTVAEIARAVDEVLGATSQVVTFGGPPAGDVGATPWSVPDPVVMAMSAAARELGYVPVHDYAGA